MAAVGGAMGTVRRSGVIIAMSSGLVATMALPAHAVSAGPGEISGPVTASMPAVANGASAFFTAPEDGLLSLPTGLALEDGTVSAPATATLEFDHTAFVAVPASAGSSAGPDLGLPGARTGSTTRGSEIPAAPRTRREARAGTTTATPSSGTATKPASTSTSSDTGSTPAVKAPSSGLGSAAVAIASRYLGVRYRFGGTTPSGFDCSGLVQYVYAQLGKKLPRTAAEQAAAVRHVSRSEARPGDLVLFAGGGHIGIYLGNGMMLDAPHTGTVVQIRKIYTTSVQFGRVA